MSRSKKNTTEGLLGLQLAVNGEFFIFGTGAVVDQNYQAIQVHEDAVFSVLADDAGVDLLVDLGIGGNTIKSGFIFSAKDGKSIANVTLASGSVIGLL